MTNITKTKLITSCKKNCGLLSKTDNNSTNNKFGLNPLFTVLNKDFNHQLREDYKQQLKTKKQIIDMEYIETHQADIIRLYKEYYKEQWKHELQRQLTDNGKARISFLMNGLNSLTRSIPITLDEFREYRKRGGYKNYVFCCEARKDIIIFDFDIQVSSTEIEKLQEALKDYLFMMEYKESSQHLHIYLQGTEKNTIDYTNSPDRNNALFLKQDKTVPIDIFKGAKKVVACSTQNNKYEIIYDEQPTQAINLEDAIILVGETLEYTVNKEYLQELLTHPLSKPNTSRNTPAITTRNVEIIQEIDITPEEAKRLIKILTTIMGEIAGNGQRHSLYMALSGAMLRKGYKKQDIKTIVQAVCRNTRDTDNRLSIVEDSTRKFKNGNKTTGWSSFFEGVTDITKDARILKQLWILKDILQIHPIPKDSENIFQVSIYDFDNRAMFSNLTRNRNICKDLLIECVKIYCTPYKEEYYLQINENEYKYIGNDWEQYLEQLYYQLGKDYTLIIPFNTLVKRIKEGRIYEKLEPHRKYILFYDCLLNIETGTTEKIKLTKDTIPYAIIEENYKEINAKANRYVLELFDRINDDNNILISLLYGLFNKKALGKGAVFNIQRSGMGKTLLLKPLVELGLCANVNHDMLTGNERAGLFRQYYSVIFEEIQDTIINGSAFNALVDNVSMQVQRKYKKDITIKKEYKPVVFINGESLADFRGRTRGTFNRFRFMPQFKEALTEDDYEYIEENLTSVGIEIIRHLMNYLQAVGQETITDNIKRSMKEEKEIFELKENKLNIIFEYIKEYPTIPNNSTHCVSKKILTEIIKELQSRGEITVDLFNSDNSIKRFITHNIIPSLEIDEGISLESSKPRSIYTNEKKITARLIECLQLTEKGEAIVTDLGYRIDYLEYRKEEIIY